MPILKRTCEACGKEFEVNTTTGGGSSRYRRFCGLDCVHKYFPPPLPKLKFTPEVQEKFLQAIADGLTLRLAAHYIGTETAVVYKFLEDNPGFAQRLEQVEAARAKKWIDLAISGHRGGGNALMLLKTLYSRDYPNPKHDVSVEMTPNVQAFVELANAQKQNADAIDAAFEELPELPPTKD